MSNGTYAAFYMEPECAQKLYHWCKSHGVQCQAPSELHCTVMFSRKPVNGALQFNNLPIQTQAVVKGWKQLGNALTLELDFPVARRIFEGFIRIGASYDYDEYIPHTTVNLEYEGELPDVIPDFILHYDHVVVEELKED